MFIDRCKKPAFMVLTVLVFLACGAMVVSAQDCDEIILDGSFEAGTPNPYWVEASTNFSTPLCTVDVCGNGGGTTGPRTGTYWVWFGGTNVLEVGSVSQSVTIPSNSTALLKFYLWNGFSSGNGVDNFKVLIDSVELFSVTEGNLTYATGYTEVILDLSSYADGSAHTLSFESTMTGPNVTNFSLDDISLTIASAVFDDVPQGYWAENYIEAIYCDGITTGCTQTPLNYCPSSDVTRQAMAAFVIRALEGEPASDYCGTGSPFTDVSTSNQFCKYIKRLYELGITTGCTPTQYCPMNSVTRQAMAAFIIRALFGETFPYTLTPYFTDVPDTSQFFKYIQKMKDEGITTGCTATEYCPMNNVTRAAMAAFLARAFLGMP